MTDKREVADIKLLRVIHDFQTERGFPPSIRDLAEMLNLSSTSMVAGRINRAKENGYLDMEPFIARTIHLTSKGLDLLVEQDEING